MKKKHYFIMAFALFLFSFKSINASASTKPIIYLATPELKAIFTSEKNIGSQIQLDSFIYSEPYIIPKGQSITLPVKTLNINTIHMAYNGTADVTEIYSNDKLITKINVSNSGYMDVSQYESITLKATSTFKANLQTFGLYSEKLPLPPDDTPPKEVTGLSYQNTITGVELTYTKPVTTNHSHYQIFRDGVMIKDNHKLENYKDITVNPVTDYTYTVKTVTTNGDVSEGTSVTLTTIDGPDVIPPSNLTDIKSSVSDTSVTFTYTKPTDPDFSHYVILRDNEEIITNHKQNTFTDTKLTPETSYTYIFKSVDITGNVSVGTSVTIKTNIENDDVPPEAPKGLEVKNANAGLMVSWNSNTEPDLAGYNVYLDGTKQNTSLIPNNFYNAYNLTNDTAYTVTVTAVDTSGNESIKSIIKSGTPNHEEMPLLEIKADIKSVAKSTEKWFSQLWLIVAFASSIPLSFVVAKGVKGLFLS